jgi:branched-chain amino acid transport system substrate-binding protein
MKPVFLASALLATVLTGAAIAQSGAPIKLANVAELSGGGATVGTNWKNGIDLAIEEINSKGGVLGRKLEVTHADSQSNPVSPAPRFRRHWTPSLMCCSGPAIPVR